MNPSKISKLENAEDRLLWRVGQEVQAQTMSGTRSHTLMSDNRLPPISLHQVCVKVPVCNLGQM